ncbi:DUF1828 domain-containing protein [Limosilactobacillus fermentum]|uniref:DUF1828 domain-containing protein n=1 Tax=Limosilactobacillus fermentum TaxID=1613 RepID=UPI00019C65A1|nr:DUF1828 domain-containing protein [Limosilactobacillus fermentum]EEI22725.1 hypothetical protein HMPREF0511_0337 [Limosilactobacillus fermentum ATCC 14931]MCH5403355.1 DUF1828 domain-containing protein [Limosilactobacillus fermentum]MDC6124720.1 DUF1828 domain-containing protein [Limosilactobacillus fermentum]MDG9736150.1 DUF1828 domain-containing protein [Limosilactobacillus fermentum]QCJ26822.1 DUF1828 domain-containing protein [Limosilactobacillus fermentum]
MTPFVDDINDQISIYVEHLANGQLRLSDDGYAISNLSFMGTELPMHRKKKLSKILRQFNINLIEEETF